MAHAGIHCFHALTLATCLPTILAGASDRLKGLRGVPVQVFARSVLSSRRKVRRRVGLQATCRVSARLRLLGVAAPGLGWAPPPGPLAPHLLRPSASFDWHFSFTFHLSPAPIPYWWWRIAALRNEEEATHIERRAKFEMWRNDLLWFGSRRSDPRSTHYSIPSRWRNPWHHDISVSCGWNHTRKLPCLSIL